MKIKTRLSISIFFVYILVGILGYVSYLNLKNIEIPLRSTIPASIEAYSNAAELQRIALELRYFNEAESHSLQSYVYSKQEFWFQRHEEFHEKYQTSENSIFDLASLEDIEFINDLKNPRKRQRNMENGILAAVKENRQEDAIDIMQSTAYVELRKEVTEKIERYVQRKAKHLNEGETASDAALITVAEALNAAVNRFTTVDISLVAIILAVLVVLRVVVVKSVIKPVEKLTWLTKELSTGHFDIRMDKSLLHSKDEIGELATAIDNMAINLDELYKTLEEKVADKTKQIEVSLVEAESKNIELSNTKKAMLNVLEDIQQEKEKFRTQVLETKKFQQAVHVATDGVIITDPESRIIYVNSAWEELTGYKLSEVTFTNPKILQTDKTPKKVYKDMWDKLTQGKSFISEDIINKKKDGTLFHAQLGIVPVQEEGKTIYYVGVIQDITKRKEVDKMKTEFIALASHQLRTPLSAMKWFLEMLIGETKENLTKEQIEMLENIDASNERMIDLVNGLLNISRIESGRIMVAPEPTNLKQVVDGVLVDLSLKLKEKEHKVKVEIEKDLPIVKLDPKLIKHVYLNLINNSIKYSPKKSIIDISIYKSEDRLITKISDNGYGIPPEEHRRIFDKFYRGANIAKLDTDGSGLGLYLTKTIVNSSGGDIWFESKENEGTTFWFSFPTKGMKEKKGEVSIDA